MSEQQTSVEPAPSAEPATGTAGPVPDALHPGQPPPVVPPPRWPGPTTAAGPVPAAAAAAAGVVAAALVPLGRPGLGWLLAGLAALAALILALRRPGTHDPAEPAPAGPDTAWPDRWEPAAWTVAALVLLAVGTVRSAGWVFTLCVLASGAATVVALSRARTVRGLVMGTLLVPAAAVRGARWASRGLAALRRQLVPTLRLGRTVAATAVVLLVFGTLLASADAAFSRLLGLAMPAVDPVSVLRWTLLFAAAAGLVLAGVFLRLAPPVVDALDGPDAGPAPPEAAGAGTPEDGGQVRLVEWLIPVATLVALFTMFVVVQLTVLFGGASYVLGPDGPTYAEYARSGFWQLLTVTALTLLVMVVVARVAPSRTRAQRWWLRGLLGPLAVLSLVIVASALLRMHTYQQAYGFTRLRVFVSVTELWLGLVFLLVLVAGIRLRARWLPRAVLATGIVAVLALATLNPDRFIAERNLARWAEGETLDVLYLQRLSPDAVPALVCLPDPHRDRVVGLFESRLDRTPDDWRSHNVARAAAAELLAGARPPDCPTR